MSTPPTPTPADLEQDTRFPSGKWVGFFLQPVLPGRHQMELLLTFRHGTIQGEGRDWVGRFHIKGRYQVEDGRCWWSKNYVGRHEIAYLGYNEGKGIWGTWSFHASTYWKGGFYIWPEGMADPTRPRRSASEDLPALEPAPAEHEVDAVVVRI